MKKLVLFVGLGVLLAGTAAVAKDTKMKKEPMGTAAGDIKWETDPKAPPGAPSIHVMWGDPTKGAYGALVKFPKGANMPMHWLTHDNHAVGMAGTLTITTEDGKSISLKHGSGGMLPGKTKHTTKCGDDAECIIMAYQPGKDDMHLVKDNKTAAGDMKK